MTAIKPNRIIWHHTADSSNAPQATKVNIYHKSRHFPISSLGYYGGYHYLIERDGTIFQYREETEIGAHDKGENYGSIGICFAGNFNFEQPTKEQEETAAELAEEIILKWSIPLSRIEPHRWNDTTDCPGLILPDNWFVHNYIYKKIGWLRRLILKLQGQLPA